MLKDQNTRLLNFDWFVSEQDAMEKEAHKGIFIFLLNIHFTSLREEDKANINSLRWSMMMGLESAYTSIWLTYSTTVLQTPTWCTYWIFNSTQEWSGPKFTLSPLWVEPWYSTSVKCPNFVEHSASDNWTRQQLTRYHLNILPKTVE